MTIDQVGEAMGVPVNLKEEDAFHLSIEEYLHALISLIDELVCGLLRIMMLLLTVRVGSTCSQLCDHGRL